MSSIGALQAVRYATRDAWLKLYGYTALGWLVTTVGGIAFGSRTTLVRFVGVLLVLGGIGMVLSGLVAMAYKLLAENGSDAGVDPGNADAG